MNNRERSPNKYWKDYKISSILWRDVGICVRNLQRVNCECGYVDVGNRVPRDLWTPQCSKLGSSAIQGICDLAKQLAKYLKLLNPSCKTQVLLQCTWCNCFIRICIYVYSYYGKKKDMMYRVVTSCVVI
jgi:hypothetical protein